MLGPLGLALGPEGNTPQASVVQRQYISFPS